MHTIKILLASVCITLGGCATMSQNEQAGVAIGGLAGGLLGSHFGSGDGRLAMTAIGAVIGATVGQNIAESLDAASKQQVQIATQQALDTAPVGNAIAWDNPANQAGPARGLTTITRSGTQPNGNACREFEHAITVNGREQRGIGVACKAVDGTWRML